MRVETRSRAVAQAMGIVLRLMPMRARRNVAEFVTAVRARNEYGMCGLSDDIEDGPSDVTVSSAQRWRSHTFTPFLGCSRPFRGWFCAHFLGTGLVIHDPGASV